jgi:predicted glycosyltransferase
MRIWVDMTSAPHALVLRPIIAQLRGSGHEVIVTARQFGQTSAMLARLGIAHEVVGRHGGASAVGKASALARRSARLCFWARRRRFDLGLAHGSVDLAVVCAILRVPAVQMQDYEFAGLQRRISFGAARRVLVPDAIPLDRLRRIGARPSKVCRYPGLKEDYYLFDFAPDPAVLDELGIDRERILAVVRPPDETAEYRSRNRLYEAVLDRLADDRQSVAVVLPRSEGQRRALKARPGDSLLVPDRVIDAQSLIAYADLVVSGGGTMNREAAALGTPAYTIFTGRIGAVDERLIAAGRLRRLSGPADLELRKRTTEPGLCHPRDPRILTEAVLGALPPRCS